MTGTNLSVLLEHTHAAGFNAHLSNHKNVFGHTIIGNNQKKGNKMSSLMNRIQVEDWLSKDYQTRLAHCRKLQDLRLGDQAAARTKRGGMTRSAAKNLKKRGKDPEAAAKAALAKLTPAQLAALASRLG